MEYYKKVQRRARDSDNYKHPIDQRYGLEASSPGKEL
jgi:hypothetical protein